MKYNGTIEVIELLNEINNFYSEKYNYEFKNNNEIEIEGIGSIKYMAGSNGQHTIEIKGKVLETFAKSFLDKVKDNNQKITEDDAKNSVFKDILTNSNYNGLKNNHILFKILDKKFSQLGIKNIYVCRSVNAEDIFPKDLLLFFSVYKDDDIFSPQPSGYYERLKNILVDGLKIKNSMSDFLSRIGVSRLSKIRDDEKIIPILFSNFEIGHYYTERNLIDIYFNPFDIEKISIINTEVPEIFEIILNELKRIGVKRVNTKGIEFDYLVSQFVANTKRRLTENDTAILRIEENITRYYSEIRELIKAINDKKQENVYLLSQLDTRGTNIREEIEKTKKLPFLKEVKVLAGSIVLYFKTIFLTIPDFKVGDHSKSFGKRVFYLGNPSIEISPGKFIVRNDNSLFGHSHPHSSGTEGTPCFGGGDADRKIFDILSQNKFSEVAKMLYFWLKTYRNDTAYVKVWDAVYDRLRKGYPVWDENGNRIELNDPNRIKTGELRLLDKEPEYDKNIELFKDMKMGV